MVACFVASVARFYHRETGFTALIGFGAAHDPAYEVTALAGVPHQHVASGGYDGQFYAQLALVPLLHDPSIDRALDAPPYRSRRIFFSWTAFVAGFGRPAWVLQIYALQNALCWLLLAVLLLRWVPPDGTRRLASWAACLFGVGMLASVRLALTDGPSMLLLAGAAAAAETGRLWAVSAILGLSGLARETNLFGLTLLQRPRTVRDAVRIALAAAIALLPLLLWQDYLYSIYRGMAFVNQNQLAAPFSGFLQKWETTITGVMREGTRGPQFFTLLATIGLTVQGCFVFSRAWTHRHAVWLRLAIPYAVLMILVNYTVWGGFPGAATRVLLPMTVGFNILLEQDAPRRFWVWYVLGNAGLVYAPSLLRPA
jgi:hypothetical protein